MSLVKTSILKQIEVIFCQNSFVFSVKSCDDTGQQRRSNFVLLMEFMPLMVLCHIICQIMF